MVFSARPPKVSATTNPCRPAGSQMGGQLVLNSNVESVARSMGCLVKGVLL